MYIIKNYSRRGRYGEGIPNPSSIGGPNWYSRFDLISVELEIPLSEWDE